MQNNTLNFEGVSFILSAKQYDKVFSGNDVGGKL